jgi:hypothetical protein
MNVQGQVQLLLIEVMGLGRVKIDQTEAHTRMSSWDEAVSGLARRGWACVGI